MMFPEYRPVPARMGTAAAPPPPPSLFSLAFDGANWVNVPDSASLEITGSISVSVWVNLTDTGGIIFKGSVGYNLSFNPGSEFKFVVNGSVIFISSAVPTNTLTHIVVTYDGTNYVMYVDGEVAESGVNVQPIIDIGDPIIIGGNAFGGTYSGTIDAIRVYNAILNSTQVTWLYGSGVGEAAADDGDGSAANLMLWLKFDEGSGSTAIDSSGNGNNGTEENAPVYTVATVLG